METELCLRLLRGVKSQDCERESSKPELWGRVREGQQKV